VIKGIHRVYVAYETVEKESQFAKNMYYYIHDTHFSFPSFVLIPKQIKLTLHFSLQAESHWQREEGCRPYFDHAKYLS